MIWFGGRKFRKWELHMVSLCKLSSLLHWQHLVFGLEDSFTIKLNHQLSSLLPFFRLHMLFIFSWIQKRACHCSRLKIRSLNGKRDEQIKPLSGNRWGSDAPYCWKCVRGPLAPSSTPRMCPWTRLNPTCPTYILLHHCCRPLICGQWEQIDLCPHSLQLIHWSHLFLFFFLIE